MPGRLCGPWPLLSTGICGYGGGMESSLLHVLVSKDSPVAVVALEWLVYGDPEPLAARVDWVVFSEPLEL